MIIIAERPAGSPNYAVLRHTKIHHVNQLTDVQRHNNREMHVPNADPNGPGPQVVWGNGAVRKAVNDRIASLGIKPKSGAVIALEILLGTSREFWKKMPEAEQDRMVKRWVRRNLAYVRARFGRDAIIGAVLHGDETTIHMHVVVVPVRFKVDNRFKDKKPRWSLTARDIVGGKGDMRQHQTRYAKAMKRFDLERGKEGSNARHVPNKEYERLLSEALDQTYAQQLEAIRATQAANEREEEAERRLAKIAEGEADLVRRIAAVEAREAQAAVTSAERAAYDARAAALAEGEAELARKRQAATTWATSARQHSADLKDREAIVKAREASVMNAQATLANDQAQVARSMDGLAELRHPWQIVRRKLEHLGRSATPEVRDAVRALVQLDQHVNAVVREVPGFGGALDAAQRRRAGAGLN